ncbi:MAG: hypothetical protein AAB403_16550 [Planctomycetota bacterium]
MEASDQADLFSDVDELQLVRVLLTDLHHDLRGKVARLRQVTDLSDSLGSSGTLLPGGETVSGAWAEARQSFVHGNYIATVLLCQGFAEHMLAAHLELPTGGVFPEELPRRISFKETLERCIDGQVIDIALARDLRRLMDLRNPLSHYRSIDDPSNLTQRVLMTMTSAEQHLYGDASFAIGVVIRLMSLPPFRVGPPVSVMKVR